MYLKVFEKLFIGVKSYFRHFVQLKNPFVFWTSGRAEAVAAPNNGQLEILTSTPFGVLNTRLYTPTKMSACYYCSAVIIMNLLCLSYHLGISWLFIEYYGSQAFYQQIVLSLLK